MREHPEGQCAYCDGVQAFESWVAIHDPDGQFNLLEQISAYSAAHEPSSAVTAA